MTCECVIALVTCVATIITTVIAVLSYLKDKKEITKEEYEEIKKRSNDLYEEIDHLTKIVKLQKQELKNSNKK